MVKQIVILISSAFLLTGAQAQSVVINENCKAAYSNILSLKLDDAKKIIDDEKTIDPQNICIPYLENYIDFLKVFISEDETLFRSLEKKIPDRIEQIEKLSDTSRFKKYLIGNINLQWAMARLKFGEYATAALEINRAYRLLEANNKLFPDFMPNTITLGILHIMIGIVPDSYGWILNLISMRGSVVQGQKELKLAYGESLIDPEYSFLKDEILFYMGMVNLSMNPDPGFANYLISKLKDADSNNLLLTYLAINTNMKIGNNDDALELFSTIGTSENYYPFCYLDYLHGECFLRTLNTGMAKKGFDDFLVNFRGQNYIKDAWRKTAWAALIDGDTTGFHKAMQNVLKHGETNIDADKSAEREAKSGNVPNVELLKCRLLFDGGYYNKAQIILANINDNELTLGEKVEVNYRFGRIAQRTNNYAEAKIHYKTTIETGSSLPKYFAANAALKLGNIHEIENDTIRAAHYYNVCLNLDFDEYRNSIRGKAKQGLKRVGGD